MKNYLSLLGISLTLTISSFAQDIKNNPTSNHGNKFEQLGTILPTPNAFRTASGAPGYKYWQQRVDYDINCSLDESKQILKGSQKVTYYNNSNDELSFIWLQLDENEHNSQNNANYQESSRIPNYPTIGLIENNLNDLNRNIDNGKGVRISSITDMTNKKLKYTINKTMMRVELPVPLKHGQQFVFKVDWTYKITDRLVDQGRGGYEYFQEDENHLFTIAQWYPRLCVYSDFQGWQNSQFTGRGEFALTFGNFNVSITVPADHVVLSTGECANYNQVLTPTQLERWNKANLSKEPIEIVTLEEAIKAEKTKSKLTKTWVFKANDVRDFAWTSSRKYIWDAMPTFVEGKKIMCMSAYAKEAYNLYRKYSTKVVAHTIQTYSKFSIPYPYPVAQSVEAANGMEYPMICFNYGRCNKDGTYSENIKYGMIGVIIHEVGHNFFPMIVNSDERQWSWMDEGLNTFVQYLTEELFDNKISTKRGPAYQIVDYMKLPKNQLEPIMTNSENIIHFGANAYAKPATALNILRETIMGREIFDYAFKEFSRRWAFKHPTPADLFRTLEDASAEDLDWFWRGWFYGIEPCDIAIDTVIYAKFDYNNSPDVLPKLGQPRRIAKPMIPEFDDISKIRNRADKNIRYLTDIDTSLRDFYWRYVRGIEKYDSNVMVPPNPIGITNELTAEEIAKYANLNLYEIRFLNKGGLVMPIIVEFTFEDGTKQTEKIPAQIWRKNENKVSKVFVTTKSVTNIKLDPLRETADIDESNNIWPKEIIKSKFTLYKEKANARGAAGGLNPMQNALKN